MSGTVEYRRQTTISKVVITFDGGLISNGDFADNDTDWNHSGATTITNNIFTYNNVSTYQELYQSAANMNGTIQPSTNYTLTFDLGINSSGSDIYISLGATEGSASYVGETLYTSGSKTINFTTPVSIGNGGLSITMQSYPDAGTFTIDNIKLVLA